LTERKREGGKGKRKKEERGTTGIPSFLGRLLGLDLSPIGDVLVLTMKCKL